MKIQQIVRLRKMVKEWRRKAASSTSSSTGMEIPRKLAPPGHVALYIGADGERQRFVIKTSVLTHPLMKALLRKMEEEVGFKHEGALSIPFVSPTFFQHLLSLINHSPTSFSSSTYSSFNSSPHDHHLLLHLLNLCFTTPSSSPSSTPPCHNSHHHQQQLTITCPL